MIGFDTETHLIAPGNIDPPIVCASFADSAGSFVLGNGDASLPDMVQHVLEEEVFGGANIRFDLACVMRTWPHLTTAIFDALERGRVHEVQIREKLLLLGTTGDLEFLFGQPVEYSLAALAYRRLGVDMSADKTGPDIWRLRYAAELDGKSAKDYPPEAYEYARRDAQITREVLLDQDHGDRQLFRTEALHVRAAFAVQLMTVRGLMVDAERKAQIEAEVDKELDPKNLPLLYKPRHTFSCIAQSVSPEGPAECECPSLVIPACPGRPFKNGKGTTKPQPEKVAKSAVLQPLVRRICEANGLPVALTDKGLEHQKAGLPVDPVKHVATDHETLVAIQHLDPAIQEFVYRAERIKLKSDYFPALEWEGKCAEVVHPNYDPLKKTGRLSSRGNRKGKDALYPSVHIQGADPRIREVFKPRPGFVYAIGDYNAIDLCALAQTLHDLFGGSDLEDQINGGVDPHTFLGAVLALEEDEGFRGIVNAFGYTGEQVFEEFLTHKNSIMPCPCPGRIKHKVGWFEHYRTFAKVFGLGVPGGMGLDTLCAVAAGYGLAMTRETADRLRKRYFQVHPQVKRYLRQWVPQQQEPGKETFAYTSPMGMKRAGCNYTEFANGRALQTPAAEGFKVAMWRVTRACYDPSLKDVLLGSYPVVNMHDELVLEVPDDELAPERAERMAELMVAGMKEVMPDVAVRVEPVLARRWTKKAKTLRDANGRLKIWGDA